MTTVIFPPLRIVNGCQDGDHRSEGLNNGLGVSSVSKRFHQAAEPNKLSKHLIVRPERRDCYCVQPVLQILEKLRRVRTKGGMFEDGLEARRQRDVL